MTLARKGSRPIVVDGVSCRWTIRSRPTYSQALAESTMTLAVGLEDSPGTTLVVTLDVMRPDNWMNAPSAPVTPSVVERAIRRALAAGWRSAENGSPFPLTMSLAEPSAD